MSQGQLARVCMVRCSSKSWVDIEVGEEGEEFGSLNTSSSLVRVYVVSSFHLTTSWSLQVPPPLCTRDPGLF